MKFPCRGCITLPICRHIGCQTCGVSALILRCELIKEFIGEDIGYGLQLDRMYKTWSYCKRGWKESI